MGYESRIIVVNKHKHINNMSWGEVIAVVNMSKMGGSFHSIFTEKVDFSVYGEDDNTEIKTDRYGDPVKYAPIEKVIEWLEEKSKESTYRRINILLGLLKSFNQKNWDEILVIHYGY